MTKLKTHEVNQRLSAKYSQGGCIYLAEVANSTGGNIKRYADGLALWLWPSKGLEIEGFEVKTSRSDLNKELQDVTKWESVGQYCTRWWLVVNDKSIVDMERIPAVWGVMYPTGWNMKIWRPASKLEPKPISPGFMMSVVRCASKITQRQLQESYERGCVAEKKLKHTKVKCDYENLKMRLEKFEKISGINIDGYDGEMIGGQLNEWRENKRKYNDIGRVMRNLMGDINSLRDKAIYISNEMAIATETESDGE
ncbi:MAG: hypothetical protein GY841_16500 [FCB group bacterium]|nr:hypothetical protein [FCB group bacterium]